MSVEVRVPQLAESVVEATVGKWYKQTGDRVEQDEVITELATDKVNVEIYAPVAGTLAGIVHLEGDVVGPNELLATVDVSEQAAETVQNNAQPPIPKEEHSSADTQRPAATPVAEKMAAATGIDLSHVHGTGVNGKVTIEDVRGHASHAQTSAAASSAAPATPAAKQNVEAATPVLPALTAALNRKEEREPLSRLRLTIIRNLKQSEEEAVRLTTFNEADMSAIMQLRTRRKESFREKFGVNLGFMSFFTKAVVGALKEYPYLNAEIQGTDVIKKLYYDIGVAVGTDKGLMVPVLRDADRKSFAQIEKEIADLAKRAREGKISLTELLGGTFTITNGGVYGSLMSTPILNGSQVGILGMHKIQERAVVVKGEIAVRPMMYLALSYDHRIVDGGDAVRFLVKIKEMLEDPETLLLEG